ncbi:MAG TPA: hypothetical protein VGF28_09985 [Thermoanaerobaculia bacterium]
MLLTLFTALSAAADLIVPQTAAPRILIPIAGDAPGANGTHFRSDIQVLNLRDQDQRVAFRWYAQAGSGVPAATRIIEIRGRRFISSMNFVNTVLNQTGVGSIDIVGIDAQGNFDPNALLHATSRIWTPQPNGQEGAMSQTFPAIVFGANPGQRKTIFGLHRGSGVRMNVGVSNPSATAQRFRFTVLTQFEDPQIIETTLPPFSMFQTNAPGTAEVIQILVENITATPDAMSNNWQAWGSSIENASGDAWSQMAFPTLSSTSPQPVMFEEQQ